LVELYRNIQKLPNKGNWETKKLEEVKQLIIACSGMFYEATTEEEYAVLGEKMNISFFVNKRNDVKVQLEHIWLNNEPNTAYDSAFNVPLNTNANLSFNKVFTVDANKKLSQPYWLAKNKTKLEALMWKIKC